MVRGVLTKKPALGQIVVWFKELNGVHLVFATFKELDLFIHRNDHLTIDKTEKVK